MVEIEPKPEDEKQNNNLVKVVEIREETKETEIFVEKVVPPQKEMKTELVKIEAPKDEVPVTNGLATPQKTDQVKVEEPCVEKMNEKTVEAASEESGPVKPPPLPPKTTIPSKVEIDERPSPRTLSLSEAILEELDLTLESEEKAKVEEGKSDVKVYFLTNFRRLVHWTQEARLSDSIEHTATKPNFSKVGESPNRWKFGQTTNWSVTTSTTSTTTLTKTDFVMGVKHFFGSNSI